MAGRVAFVTGASKGLGRAVALALGRAGERVAVGYHRDAEGASETLAASDGNLLATVPIDVADPASVDAAFQAIEKDMGPVEILVNSAGITRDNLLVLLDDDRWSEVLRTNLDGAFFTCRRAARRMTRARFGRIVNVGSVAWAVGAPGQVNYASAKAGLVGLTRAVARELASRRITCNLVAPGPVTTAMTEALPAARRREIESLVPLGRFGAAEEVAAVVAFLCSDEAGYVTGGVIPVDGGLGMGH